MANTINQEAPGCSNCSLLRSNLSDVMKRLGDHDMLVRMHDLATKQRDLLQKQLCAAIEGDADSKRECAAMQVRTLCCKFEFEAFLCKNSFAPYPFH
jgi:hypothetical protein